MILSCRSRLSGQRSLVLQTLMKYSGACLPSCREMILRRCRLSDFFLFSQFLFRSLREPVLVGVWGKCQRHIREVTPPTGQERYAVFIPAAPFLVIPIFLIGFLCADHTIPCRSDMGKYRFLIACYKFYLLQFFFILPFQWFSPLLPVHRIFTICARNPGDSRDILKKRGAVCCTQRGT